MQDLSIYVRNCLLIVLSTMSLCPPFSAGAGIDVRKSRSDGAPVYEIRAFRIAEPIKLDGRLDEPAWSGAEQASGFTQREPREGEAATEPTEVRILYDNAFLYIGAMCFDSRPDEIRANEMRRDVDLKDNDYLEVIFDTFLSRRNGFYFAVNPLGARRDALIQDNGSNINWDWDGIWTARTKVSDRGWSVEMAIPFKTLRFSKLEDQIWGVNFGRQIARKREETFWTPVLRNYGRDGNLKASYLGRVSGLNNLGQGERLQIMPSLISGFKKADRSAAFKAEAEPGLDMKYRLASNLTADVTVNTDFAQVEADQEQFNLTRFDLFFPEKREFFLEGADIFRIGERTHLHENPSALMFFSRSIGLSKGGREVPILGGIRLTGKAGGFEMGALDIATARLGTAPNGGHDSNGGNIDRTNYSVFRLKRDLFSKSSVGVMLFSKDSLDGPYFNRGAGLDFSLAFGDYVKSSGFAFKTFTPGKSGRDGAAYLDFVYESDLLSADLQVMDIGDNFNAEMGFVNRTGIRRYRSNLSFRPRPGILNIRKSYLYNKIIYIDNRRGRLESRLVEFGNFNSFNNGAMLSFSYEGNRELLINSFLITQKVFIPVGRYSFVLWSGRFESDKSRDFAFEAGLKAGAFYSGRLFQMSGKGLLRLSKNINVELMYERNAFDLPVDGGHFTTHIAAGRFIYSFSPDLFAKTYIQWNSSEGLFKINFLVRWIYKPGANLYLIYNETREVGESDFLRDRVLMLKASFLFDW